MLEPSKYQNLVELAGKVPGELLVAVPAGAAYSLGYKLTNEDPKDLTKESLGRDMLANSIGGVAATGTGLLLKHKYG